MIFWSKVKPSVPYAFFDVGALVWFAKIIEWEFPGFCVDGCLDRLAAAQALLESGGSIEGPSTAI